MLHDIKSDMVKFYNDGIWNNLYNISPGYVDHPTQGVACG